MPPRVPQQGLRCRGQLLLRGEKGLRGRADELLHEQVRLLIHEQVFLLQHQVSEQEPEHRLPGQRPALPGTAVQRPQPLGQLGFAEALPALGHPRRDGGEQRLEQAQLVGLFEDLRGCPRAENLENLFSQPLAGALPHGPAVPADQSGHAGRDLEACEDRVLDRPDHAHRVLGKGCLGRDQGPKLPPADVGVTLHVVDELLLHRAVVQGIEGEIPGGQRLPPLCRSCSRAPRMCASGKW